MCASSSVSEMYRTPESTFEGNRECAVFRKQIKSLRESGGKRGFPEIRKRIFKVGIMVQERSLVLE